MCFVALFCTVKIYSHPLLKSLKKENTCTVNPGNDICVGALPFLLHQGLCRKLEEIFHYSVALGTHASSTLNNPHICNRYGCCFSALRGFFFQRIHPLKPGGKRGDLRLGDKIVLRLS